MHADRRALIDEVLGGLTSGFPTVIAGPTGSGRTVLCLEAADRMLCAGEPVVFLTGEPARLLLRQADALNLSLGEHLRSGRFTLLELDPQVGSSVRAHGGRAFFDAVVNAAPDARLILVDPLSALTHDLHDEAGLRSLIREFFEAAAAAGMIVVSTVEASVLRDKTALERVLKEACGSYVDLGLDQQASCSFVSVTKSRAAGFVAGHVRFEIGPGGTRRLGEARGERRPGNSERPDSSAPVAGEGPARPSTPAVLRPGDAAARSPDRARPVILVVEDDVLTRTMLRDWLGERYEIVEAEDGFTAMTALMASRPDLMILDLQLPRVSGFEVLQALRKAGATLPVLVVSGTLARASDRVRVLVLGATDMMHKPVHRFELSHKIETLLTLRTDSIDTIGSGEVEALLAGAGRMHVLDEPQFRTRVERACHFGDEYGLGSVMVAVQASSEKVRDALIEAAANTLRAEDAVVALPRNRALFLIVSTEFETALPILLRFGEGMKSSKTSTRGVRYHARVAEPVDETKSWDAFFEDLQPWPRPEKRSALDGEADS